ncbi:MAG: MerR family transcriptional regulator [Nitrospirae bacterium]|nr:MAG: MerR family transcriptional regulator [Nitrospirota bacterium]MBI5203388.1 MerR family transcriptional regulator [Nitrospirota bacterium]
MKKELTEDEKKEAPLYPIGIVAELIGTTDQTLRLYEKHGLLKPARRNKNRFYSENDIKWLRCLRELIHTKKISIEGIKKLLEYAPCWEITVCSEERKNKCSAYIDKTKPCWELNRMICNKESGKICEDCIVYISKKTKKK